MCSSMAAGFYLPDVATFDLWQQHLNIMSQQQGDKFIFTVFEKEPVISQQVLRSSDAAAAKGADEGEDSFEDLGGFEVV